MNDKNLLIAGAALAIAYYFYKKQKGAIAPNSPAVVASNAIGKANSLGVWNSAQQGAPAMYAGGSATFNEAGTGAWKTASQGIAAGEPGLFYAGGSATFNEAGKV